MSSFDIAHGETMGTEGGYDNNPHDAGGETYKGIARTMHPNWPGWKYVDGIKGGLGAMPAYGSSAYYSWAKQFNKYAAAHPLIQDLVVDFYRTNFWDANRLGEIESQAVANWAYDHAVNGGARGIQWLQAAAGVKQDGQLGPVSLTVINSADPVDLLNRAKEFAVAYRVARVRERPDQRQFLHSWLARDGLTEAEIRAVVATV